jgi:hypothetical protein
MEVVSAKVRKKRVQNTDTKRWFAALYRAHYSGKTLNGARWIYNKETGKWPKPKDLPFCPEQGSTAWQLEPALVYPNLVKKKKDDRYEDELEHEHC